MVKLSGFFVDKIVSVGKIFKFSSVSSCISVKNLGTVAAFYIGNNHEEENDYESTIYNYRLNFCC